MTTYYKAVRPDGTDFHSGTVQWATPGAGPTRPRTVKHPTAKQVGSDASEYLSVSTVPTECTGMQWPCRLLTVEPVEGHEVTIPNPDTLPHKRASTTWRVTGEVDAHAALGPQSAQIAALIARAATLTPDEARRLRAAWGAAWDAAWALVARDLISTEHYDTLTTPWRTVIGPIHPDDPNLA